MLSIIYVIKRYYFMPWSHYSVVSGEKIPVLFDSTHLDGSDIYDTVLLWNLIPHHCTAIALALYLLSWLHQLTLEDRYIFLYLSNYIRYLWELY